MTGKEQRAVYYEGGCHCGRVRFRVAVRRTEAIECNCSICTKKGIVHLIVPAEDFELLCGREQLTTYQFNTRVAKHSFCKHCGVHAFYTPRSHPAHFDVNVRCLDGIALEAFTLSHFDGKNWEANIERIR